MLQGRTTRELAAMRQDLDKLTAQVNALVRYFAEFPQAPRQGWERHSLPSFEDTKETYVVPAVRPQLTVLPRRIMDVTICTSGNQQWVNAYDANGERIPEYCGTFRNVGRKIIEREPNLRWRQVAESA